LYRTLGRGLRIFSDSLTGQSVDWHMHCLEKTQWMRKKELRQLQLSRLKKLLYYAYRKVPFYHRSFRKGNFRPADLKTLEDLRKVPVLRKSDIRYNLSQLVSTDYSRADLEVFTTSGTSATPLRFYRSMTELSWARGAEFRAYGWGGYRFGDKMALIWGYEPEQTRSFVFKFYHLFMRQRILNVSVMSEKSMSSFARSFVFKFYHLFMRQRILNVSVMSEKSMSSFARSLVRFKPDFVKGYSAATNVFANYLLKNRQFKIRPRAGFTSAATLLPHHRKAIEKAFNCKVYDVYGSREISGTAGQCGQHEGLHVSDENVVLEIVKDGETASVGEDGQIYLTNLQSHAMPFIRYDIGDIGRSFPDECPCGRKLSLMKPFGRTYEYLVNSDGAFTTLRDLQQVFEDIPIVDFQIVQEDRDEIVVRIVTRSGYNQTHTDFIEEHIKMRGKAKIRVELVDALPKERSGKTKHIITKLDG